MIHHYIKVALRNLLKHKTQNIISTIGLVVGLLCFSICFYINRFMGSVDQCFEHYESLVELSLTNAEGKEFSGTPYSLLKELRERQWVSVESFTSVSYVRGRSYNVQIDNQKVLPYELKTMEVDSLFERLFTPTVIVGSWRNIVHIPNAVVLTKSAARRIFPKMEDAIGRQMVLTNRLGTSPETTPQSGGIAYTVQAIIEDIPANTSLNFLSSIDMLTLNDSEGAFQVKDPGYTGTNTYALLRKGKTVDDLRQEIKKTNISVSFFTEKGLLKVAPMGQREKISSITFVFSLVTGTAGLLILLIGLLNFYHFQIGSFLNRYSEFTLRKVLGNSVGGLFRMQFVQMTLVILLTVLLTGCLIELLSPGLYISFAQFRFQVDKSQLFIHLAQYTFGLLLVSSFVCWGTALHCRRMTIQAGIRGSGKRGGKRRLRNTFLGIQFFICWLFICLTVALYLQAIKTTESLYDTLSVDEKSEIIGFSVGYTFINNEEKLAFIDRVSQYPGIKEVMPVDIAFTKGVSGGGLYEGENKESYLAVSIVQVPSSFFSFMHLPLIAGRAPQTSDEIVVSRSFAEKQKKDVLGKVYYDWNQKGYTICGVADHFNTYIYNDGFGEEFSQCAYFPFHGDKYVGYCYLKCVPGQEEAVRKALYKDLRALLPENVEPEIQSLVEEIQSQQEVENSLKEIVLFFAVVSLIITLLGVYSAITLDAEHRQKEVAIRKVNGAGITQIIVLFARLYAFLLGGSAFVAFSLVYLILMQWKTMYQVFFNSGILYWGGIFVGVTLLVAFTVLSRILKIIRINPAEIIKSE